MQMQIVYDERFFDMDERIVPPMMERILPRTSGKMIPRVEAFHLHNPMDPAEERLGKQLFRYGLVLSCLLVAGMYLVTL